MSDFIFPAGSYTNPSSGSLELKFQTAEIPVYTGTVDGTLSLSGEIIGDITILGPYTGEIDGRLNLSGNISGLFRDSIITGNSSIHIDSVSSSGVGEIGPAPDAIFGESDYSFVITSSGSIKVQTIVAEPAKTREPKFPIKPIQVTYDLDTKIDLQTGVWEVSKETTSFSALKGLYGDRETNTLHVDEDLDYDIIETDEPRFISSRVVTSLQRKMYDASRLTIRINISEDDFRALNIRTTPVVIKKIVASAIRNALALKPEQVD